MPQCSLASAAVIHLVDCRAFSLGNTQVSHRPGDDISSADAVLAVNK